jgi:hypothetical protein
VFLKIGVQLKKPGLLKAYNAVVSGHSLETQLAKLGFPPFHTQRKA